MRGRGCGSGLRALALGLRAALAGGGGSGGGGERPLPAPVAGALQVSALARRGGRSRARPKFAGQRRGGGEGIVSRSRSCAGAALGDPEGAALNEVRELLSRGCLLRAALGSPPPGTLEPVTR